MKIEMGKKYRTRDGRDVRIYAVDCGGTYSVHGAITSGEVQCISCWKPCGKHNNYGDIDETGRNDLIEIKEDWEIVRDQIKKTGVAIVNIHGEVVSVMKITNESAPLQWYVNRTDGTILTIDSIVNLKLATKEEVIEYFFGGEKC